MPTEPAAYGRPMVELRRVSMSFGRHRVLNNVSLTVSRGEMVAIIGPSGSGKTTLLRCINFLEEYDGGEVLIDGLLGAGAIGVTCQKFGAIARHGLCLRA